MELDIWDGDWGLPSVDLHCLEVMAYAKFSGVRLVTKVTNNPFWTPNGELPVFRHGSHVFATFVEIANYLRKKNFSADFILTPKQSADVDAYSQLLRDKLYPCLQFIWWVDEKNYIDFSRPWYAKALPLPYNYYYPGKYEKQAKKLMTALYGDIEYAAIEANVYAEAERCLIMLSHRLGEADFFFGSHPTSLDATAYAYLAPLLKAPFPNPALQNFLKSCDNLLRFVVRISQRYFPTEVKDYETKKMAENNAKSAKDSETDFPNKRRNQILAGIFATAAMTGYALSTGLVEVTMKADDEDAQEKLSEYHDLFEQPENAES